MISLFMLSGCSYYLEVAYNPLPYTKDVSEDKSKWGGYDKDAVYELEYDVYLLEKEQKKLGKYFALAVPLEMKDCLSCVAFYHDPSFDQYKWNKDYYEKRGQHYMDILGIVEKGTAIQCTRFIERGDLNFGDVDIYAEILEGKYKGYDVTINSISCYNDCNMGRVLKYRPEPNLLTKIEE